MCYNRILLCLSIAKLPQQMYVHRIATTAFKTITIYINESFLRLKCSSVLIIEGYQHIAVNNFKLVASLSCFENLTRIRSLETDSVIVKTERYESHCSNVPFPLLIDDMNFLI